MGNPQSKYCCLLYICYLSKCRNTSYVYLQLIFFVCVSDASQGCVEGMQKQMPMLGVWKRALNAPLSCMCAAIFVRGDDEGGSDGKHLLSIAGFLPDGKHLLGRQCCFPLQQLIGREATVEHPRITVALSPSAWKLYASPKLPQLLPSLPIPFAGTDTGEVSKRSKGVGWLFLT